MGKAKFTANALPRAGVPVMFKQCIKCGIYYEYIGEFYEFDVDNECVYCKHNKPENPWIDAEGHPKADFIMLEDID